MPTLLPIRPGLLCAAALVAIACTANGAQAPAAHTGQYQMTFYADCKPVAQVVMTPQLVQAHGALQAEEQKMAALQAPLTAMEAQLQTLSADMERVAKVALQETATTIRIDKAAMRQQEAIGAQIEQVVANHQAELDAVQRQATRVAAGGDAFEQEVRAMAGDLDYNRVRISRPGEDPGSLHCRQTG